MKEGFQYDIFLSHSKNDTKVAVALAKRFERDDLKVWYFERESRSGSIPSQIEAGLNASQLLLQTISKHGVESEWMQLERDVFVTRDPCNKTGSIIPLRLDNTSLTGILATFKYYNWVKRNLEEYNLLLGYLKEHAIGKTSTTDRANIARVYDYFLGGDYNTAADRAAACEIRKVYPKMKNVMITNRAFLRRAVRYLAERGVKQFVDVGSGLPTQGNTHEIAQTVCRDAKVVYVDCDTHVVELSRELTKNDPNIRVVLGDLERPMSILNAPEMEIVDFSKPVGLLLVAVIHFITDDNIAQRSVSTLRQSLASGSYLVISHASRSKELGAATKPIGQVYVANISKVKRRQEKELFALFSGTTLAEPGLVWAPEWHPEIKDPYISASRLPFVHNPYRSLVRVGVGAIPFEAEDTGR